MHLIQRSRDLGSRLPGCWLAWDDFFKKSKKGKKEEVEDSGQKAVRAFWPLPALLESLFPRVGRTHVSSGRLSEVRDGYPASRSLTAHRQPFGGGGHETLSIPHPTPCMWTPNTDLAPTGLGRVESLPGGTNIKTPGWLLPTVIRSKAFPCSHVPMTGLQQQKPA